MSRRQTRDWDQPVTNVSAITGRRRKLTDGQMIAITEQFRAGARASEIAEMYNISPGVVYSICYWTPRDKDVR